MKSERLINELSKIPHRILFFQRDYIELEEYDPHDEYENDQEKSTVGSSSIQYITKYVEGPI